MLRYEVLQNRRLVHIIYKEGEMVKRKIRVEEGTYALVRYTGLCEEKIKVPNRNVRDAIRKAESLEIVKARGCGIISLYFYDEVSIEMPYHHKGTQMSLSDCVTSNQSRTYYPDAKLLTSAKVRKIGSWLFKRTKIKGKKSVVELNYSPDPACRPLLICSNPKIYKGYVSVGKEAHMCPSAAPGSCSL
jgi:hypothetical protein